MTYDGMESGMGSQAVPMTMAGMRQELYDIAALLRNGALTPNAAADRLFALQERPVVSPAVPGPFEVMDSQTGSIADLENIAACEDWAQKLDVHELDGFAVREDGNLILLDGSGGWAVCPANRYQVVPLDQDGFFSEKYFEDVDENAIPTTTGASEDPDEMEEPADGLCDAVSFAIEGKYWMGSPSDVDEIIETAREAMLDARRTAAEKLMREPREPELPDDRVKVATILPRHPVTASSLSWLPGLASVLVRAFGGVPYLTAGEEEDSLVVGCAADGPLYAVCEHILLVMLEQVSNAGYAAAPYQDGAYEEDLQAVRDAVCRKMCFALLEAVEEQDQEHPEFVPFLTAAPCVCRILNEELEAGASLRLLPQPSAALGLDQFNFPEP